MDGTVLVTGATAWDRAGAGPAAAGTGHTGSRARAQPQRAAAAVERIGGGEVAVADLASFAQVRALVDDVGGRFELQGLVNNAGIGYNTAPPRGQWTEDGHEPTWQVNFLSAFLLTMGLQDSLAAGRRPESCTQARGPLQRQRRPRAAGRAASCQPLRAVQDRAGDARPGAGRAVAGSGRGRQRLQSRMDRHQDGRCRRRLAARASTPLWLLTAAELAGTTGRYFYQRHEERPKPAGRGRRRPEAPLGPCAERVRQRTRPVSAPAAPIRAGRAGPQ